MSTDSQSEISVLKVKIAHLEKGHDRHDLEQAEQRGVVNELRKGQQELGHQVKALGMEMKFDLEATKHQIEERFTHKLDEMASAHTKQVSEVAATHTAELTALAVDVNTVKVDLKVFFGRIATAGAVVLLLIQYAPDLIPFL